MSEFFGLPIESLDKAVQEAAEQYGELSTECGAALVALGNAQVAEGGGSLGDALISYERALQIFESLAPSTESCADVHHRMYAVARRRDEPDLAAYHLEKAIGIWEDLGSRDDADLAGYRDDAHLMRTIQFRRLAQQSPP